MSDSQYLCLKNIIALCIGVLFLFSFEATFAEQSEIELQYTADSLDKEGKIGRPRFANVIVIFRPDGTGIGSISTLKNYIGGK